MSGNWYGWDGYHNGGSGGPAKYIAAWKHIHAIFTSVYSVFESYGKPLMISEFACATDEVYSKADWITDAFLKIKNSYPKIKVFNWFNISKERDWRVNSSTGALNAFKNAINDSYFFLKQHGY